jgi:hypothetical protein
MADLYTLYNNNGKKLPFYVTRISRKGKPYYIETMLEDGTFLARSRDRHVKTFECDYDDFILSFKNDMDDAMKSIPDCKHEELIQINLVNSHGRKKREAICRKCDQRVFVTIVQEC